MAATATTTTTTTAKESGQRQPAAQGQLPSALQFMFGGLAGMGATLVVQPFDVVKTRMQLHAATPGVRADGPLATMRGVVASEGASRLYSGLSAALFRQVTYTTTRLGAFGVITDALKRQQLLESSRAGGAGPAAAAAVPGESLEHVQLSFAKKAVAGLSAGAVGAFIGTPADVALIRMMADGKLPPAQRRGYTSVFNALARIVREEGVLTLWRGTLPTVGRAALLNMAQLGTYAQAKEAIVHSGAVGDHMGAHVLASTVSGFAATCVSLPLDNAKTKLQNMSTPSAFTGMADALMKTVRAEGVLALWSGFAPYFLRLTPHTIGAFVILEQLKAAYWRLSSDSGGGSGGSAR